MPQSLAFLKEIYNRLRGAERARRYNYLFEIIRKNRSQRIMEIGIWNGARSLAMIKIAQKFHSPGEVEYYGFDIFELMNEKVFKKEVSKRPPTMEQVQDKLEASGAKIHLFKGFTEETLPKVVHFLPKMDLVFIDGGHSIETIINDWRWTQQIMDSNTVVIFDDYWSGEWGKRKDAGCQNIIDVLDRTKFEVKVLPVQDKFKKDWGILKINFVQVKRVR